MIFNKLVGVENLHTFIIKVRWDTIYPKGIEKTHIWRGSLVGSKALGSYLKDRGFESLSRYN
jgi:hypothetical protein